MGLGDWINRNIVEYQPEDPPPKPEDPPEQRAKRVALVPIRPAQDLLAELEPADLSALEPVAGDAPAGPPPSAPVAAPAPSAGGPLGAEPEGVAADPAGPAAPARDPLAAGGAPPVSIAQVYETARIERPAHGFTLEKLSGMLADPRLAKLDTESRAAAIAVVLESAGVKLEAIVRDAAQRDAALDQFAEFLSTKLIDRQVATDEKVAAIEAEIERFVSRKRDEIASLQERLHQKQVELARFRRVKRGEELRLLEVVRHFTKEPTISVGDDPAPQG